MNNEGQNNTNKPNRTTGYVLIAIGACIGFFGYSHRPIEGLLDGFQRDTWFLNPFPYYVIMAVASLLLFLGARILMKSGLKASDLTGIISKTENTNLEDLKKAKELFDSGAITAAEFETLKNKALNR